MCRGLALVALLAALSGCGGPLSFLTGGGPNVAANVQAGKTNSQTVGTTRISEQKVVRPQARSIEQSAGQTGVRSERVETVIVNEYPVWLVLAFALAVFLDSPLRWPGQIIDAFRRKKDV